MNWHAIYNKILHKTVQKYNLPRLVDEIVGKTICRFIIDPEIGSILIIFTDNTCIYITWQDGDDVVIAAQSNLDYNTACDFLRILGHQEAEQYFSDESYKIYQENQRQLHHDPEYAEYLRLKAKFHELH